MKERIFYFIVIAALILLLFNKKESEDKYEVLVTEKVGVFSGFKPIPIPSAKYTIVYNNEIIEYNNEINDSLYKLYVSSENEVDKLKLYIKSITKNKYTETLEDERVKITFDSEVTGTLDSYNISYTTKELKVKRSSYLNLGARTSLNTSGNLDYKIGVDLINKKRSVFSLYGNNNSIELGASINIIKI